MHKPSKMHTTQKFAIQEKSIGYRNTYKTLILRTQDPSSGTNGQYTTKSYMLILGNLAKKNHLASITPGLEWSKPPQTQILDCT